MPTKPEYGREDECGTLIPSMSFSGSTLVTESTALTDQHRVDGTCDVLYWLTAEFQSHGIVTKTLRRPVDMQRLSTTLHLNASSSPTANLESTASVSLWSTIRRAWPSKRKSPVSTFSLSLPSHLGIISDSQERVGVKCQSIAIPLTVALQLPSHSTADTWSNGVLHHGLSADVTALWHTRRVFATNGLSQSRYRRRDCPRISRHTVVTEKAELTFPPLLCHKNDLYPSQGSATSGPVVYSTTDLFYMSLPETVSSPSVYTDLLRISYELELAVSFKGSKQSIGRLDRCTARMKVPLLLQLA